MFRRAESGTSPLIGEAGRPRSDVRASGTSRPGVRRIVAGVLGTILVLAGLVAATVLAGPALDAQRQEHGITHHPEAARTP